MQIFGILIIVVFNKATDGQTDIKHDKAETRLIVIAQCHNLTSTL